MQKTVFFLFVLTLMAGCNTDPVNNNTNDTTTIIHRDTIPALRTRVATDPVAAYNEKVPDELNHWKFSVSVYETKNTFDYTIRIQYKELRTTDFLTVPDLGIMPNVAVRKGNAPMSCIIGFMDQKNQFMPYKLVSVKNEQLKVLTTNHYRVGRYRRKV